MKNVIATLLIASALLVAGCPKKEEPAPAASGGIGVPECDEYVTKYTACIAKMPPAAKGTAEQGLKAQVNAWVTMAATPEGKTTLKAMCKPTLDGLANNPLCK